MVTEFEDLFPEDIKTDSKAVAIKQGTAIDIRGKYHSPLMDEYGPEKWMKNIEIAEMFGVDPKTVTKWFKTGRLANVKMFKTPGGHRRYNREDIMKIVKDNED